MSIIISNKELVKARFDKIVEKLSDNPFEEYRIQTLALEAGISKYHFHRLFLIFYGVNIYEFIILLRLRAAAKKLKYGLENITAIALDCGYSSSQSFTKAFKNYFNKSPSEFRKHPDIKRFTALSHKLQNVENITMPIKTLAVKIVNFPQTNIVSLRHQGSQSGLHASIGKFINWRHEQNLFPKNYATYNVFHNPLSDDEYDIELGCEYSAATLARDGIVFSQIPSTKCASLIYFGSPDDISIPATNLYNWVLDNGYEIAEFPLFCKRISFPPFVEEDKSETIIYLPIK
jgi:AraC family transcriptional regulator